MRHLAAALFLVACGPKGPVLERPLTDVPLATDVDADPKIVKVRLIAGEGTAEYLPDKAAPVWAYRDATTGSGVVPAPTIVARQGDTIVVELEKR